MHLLHGALSKGMIQGGLLQPEGIYIEGLVSKTMSKWLFSAELVPCACGCSLNVDSKELALLPE